MLRLFSFLQHLLFPSLSLSPCLISLNCSHVSLFFWFPCVSQCQAVCFSLRLGVLPVLFWQSRVQCAQFTSPVSLCLFVPAVFPCISIFPNHPAVFILWQFPFVSCQVSSSSPFVFQVSRSVFLEFSMKKATWQEQRELFQSANLDMAQCKRSHQQ